MCLIRSSQRAMSELASGCIISLNDIRWYRWNGTHIYPALLTYHHWLSVDESFIITIIINTILTTIISTIIYLILLSITSIPNW